MITFELFTQFDTFMLVYEDINTLNSQINIRFPNSQKTISESVPYYWEQ